PRSRRLHRRGDRRALPSRGGAPRRGHPVPRGPGDDAGGAADDHRAAARRRLRAGHDGRSRRELTGYHRAPMSRDPDTDPLAETMGDSAIAEAPDPSLGTLPVSTDQVLAATT